MNVHHFSYSLSGFVIEDCCFISDPFAPDVSNCKTCQDVQRIVSEDILDAEYIEED